ncbi:MAG: VWA domain-containing protein [bacterium]|nr:VWA domain-containing protein [bacterium]
MNRKEYNQEYDVFETPNTLWENIEKQLDEPRKKRRIGWWISSVGVAAAAVLVSLLVWNQNEEGRLSEKKAPMMAKAETEQNRDESAPTKDNGNDAASAEFDSKDKNLGNAKESEFKKVESLASVQQKQSASKSQSVVYEWGAAVGNSQVYYNISAADVSHSTVTSGNGIGWSNGLTTNFSGRINSSADRSVMQGYAPDFDLDTEPYHGSTYDQINENQFISTKKEAQSTFSIDVDGASYSDVRGMIKRGVLPNPDAVRIEELINYFPYNYDEPKGDHPFAFHTEVIDCPWNAEHQLMKIGIKGESIEKEALPPNNLVFLMDVSGSMTSPEKLGLIKKGFSLLVQEMREEDRVAICVYAGAAGLVLEPTSGANKDKIMDAINRLEAGGSTAGGEGIELAYATAQKYFNSEGNNRVILATDGDFNVGVSNDDALVKLIERKRESGVALTVLGVGHDNFQSSKMEKIANNGNGNFSYIDNILEAKKVLVTEMGATLKTIAKDVKLQLDFNPQKVEKYRLIGYENRVLANKDFDNDAVDAGELGAGHTVTAIYEIVPVQSNSNTKDRDVIGELENIIEGKSTGDDELAVLKFRYKQPQGSTSQLITTSISDVGSICSTDMRFITAVVEFGLLLRNSEFKGTANFERILKNARLGLGRDPYGYRSEFIQLVQKTQRLKSAD